MFALVLPGEMVPQPDVRKTLSAPRLTYRFFKRVTLAGGVAGSRVRFSQHIAKIDEVGLRAGLLGLGVDLPAVREYSNRKRHEGS